MAFKSFWNDVNYSIRILLGFIEGGRCEVDSEIKKFNQVKTT